MKILVTGGAGFIAGPVVEGYIKAGHEVVVIDDLSGGRRENVHPAARLYEVDIRSPAVREVIEREQPEVLNHHAAQMDVRRSVADPMFDANVNIVGFLNLLEAGRAHGLKRVLFASSGGTVYGEQEQFPAKETHPTAPLSPYGITKLASEHYLHFYAMTYGLSYVALRYANVYGPRQNPHGEAGVVAIFTVKLLAGEQPVINGAGKQTRDYVFVEDVVRANLLALESDYTGPLNIGTAVETNVNVLFSHLVRESGSSASEMHGPAKAGEQARSVLDPGQALAVLGWKPKVDLAEGLRRTVEDFRQKEEKRRSSAG
jgi:UDP-glucose 4-epimerase